MRPTILFFVHAWGGGTIRAARELAAYLAPQVRVVFAWCVEERTLHVSTRDPELSEQSFPLADGLHAPLATLKALGVARVDVMCTVGALGCIDPLLDGLGVPFDVTHFGYELIAYDRDQIDSAGRYIGDARFLEIARGRLARGELPAYIDKAERYIVPSRDSARRWTMLMPDKRTIAARLPEPVDPHAVAPRITPPQDGEPLRLLILGRIAPQKGVAAICELVQLADSRNAPVHFTSLGEPQIELPEALTASPRATVLGAYAQEDLASIVACLNPHLALLPFRVPETHSYALSEVMRLGLPVLATGIGAIPERVQGRPATWLLDAEQADAGDFLDWIERLHIERLATAPRWLPIAHLPPLAADFYAADYLAPLGMRL